MGKKKAAGDRVQPRQHYCREHDLRMRVVALGFKRAIRLVCPEGCVLPKGQTVKR